MVVATSLLGFINKAFSAFSRTGRPNLAWTSVSFALFALLACAYVSPTPASATAGINQQINFQGRLLNQQGATVPDGYYNIQFKIYQDGDGQSVGNTTGSPAGTLLWTESHLNNNSQGVVVKNGFMSVQLGAINAFGSQVDWNQDTLWLSMNIGNTNGTCTPFSNCAPDGEMVPMKRMAAVAYALNAANLNGLASTNFVQLAQGVQTDASTASSIFINKTNTGNLIQLQNAGADVFTVTNAGDLTFGANANHTLSIGTSAADVAGKTLTIAAGAGGSGAGAAGGDLVLGAGAAGGTDGNGGNVTLNAGAKTGTGTDGTISIGTANTSAITLGQNTTVAAGKSLTLVGGDTASRPTCSSSDGKLYYDTDTDQLLICANNKWQADAREAVLVAASDSSPAAKAAADYIADGTADEAEITSAIAKATATTTNNLGSRKVYLFAGTYTIADTISLPNNFILSGAGKGTLLQFGNLGGVSKNMITNTTTGGSGTGVTIRDLKLDGNKTTNSTDTFMGIYLDGMGSSSTNLVGATITDVVVQNFENHGIYTTDSANNTITGNTIQSNDDHGIYTNNATTGNHDIITNNTITGNTLNGIYLNATVRSIVAGNFIGSNGNYGIRIEAGANNTINGNILRSNTGSGATSSIHVIGGGGTEAHLITDNNITDTAGTGYAINLVDAAVDGVYLSNNTFSGTGASTINDASGGDTIYSGQTNGNSYLIQPVDDFSITGNAASSISTTAGDLTVQGGSGTVTLGTSTNLTASGALTVASGASTALTLTSHAAATWSTTSGNLTLDAAGSLELGASGAPTTTAINLNQNTTLAAGKSLTIVGGATGTRPASPTEGMIYYDTDTDQLLVYANGKWQADQREAVLVAANDSSPAAKASADFIADGTGDQAEINDAITEATTTTGNNLGSRKVYLFAGTYTIASSINLPNNITFSGSGNGTVIKFASSVSGTVNAITNTDTTTGAGINIMNLALDGNKANTSAGTQAGVWLDGVGSATSNRTGAKVTGVEANNFRFYGIVTANSANTVVIGNVANSNDNSGIVVSSNATTSVTGNVANGNSSYGIWVFGSNTNTIASNNTYANGVVNIHIQGGNYNSITGNTASTGTQYGIYLNTTSNNTVTANNLSVNALAGLYILNGTYNILSANSLYNNGGSTTNNAIHLNGADNNSITGNNINDSSCTTSCYAINVANATSDANYLSNNALGNGTVNDASGGDTVFAGQNNGSTYMIQPVDDFAITGNAASTISTTAGDLTVQGGSGTVTLGTSTNLTASGALTIGSAASTALTLTSNAAATWGTTSGNLTLDAGATLNLGTTNATGLSLSKTGSTTTVNGHLTLATGQNLTVNGDVITDLTGSGLTVSGTALTVDSSSSTGFFRNGGNSFGGTAILGTNDNNSLSFETNNTTRATFSSTTNTLYLGNGDATGVAASPNSFTIQATSNSGTGAGGALTIQAGGSGSASNGADLTLNSGTGGNNINGQVIISTPTFKAYSGALQVCSGAATTLSVSQQSIDNFGTVNVASTSSASCTISVPNPSITTAGRVLYITADNTSTSSFTLSINGGGAGNLVAMRANSSATLVWNGSKWAPAGASSSTTLQAAYDNTIQTPGGAELIISKTSSTNGLTIRDSTGANAVNGALVNIQSSSAANLLSVNSNVTEYASNAGAETQGASGSTFPSSTWSAYGTGASVARNTTSNNNSIATGQASAAVTTSGGSSANTGVQNQIVDSSGAPLALLANNHYNVSFSVRLPDGAATFNDLNVRYQYDGTTTNTVTCTTGKVVAQNVWTKVNCSFTAPASGITSANVIRIEQGSTASRTFYVDNLSVTIAADYSLATDGSVDAALGSNWNAVNGASVARSTTFGNNASSSVEVTTTTTTNQGVNNLLSIKPLQNTLYRVTVYLASTTNMSGAFDIRYSPDNGTTFVSCEDYNTSTISTSLTAFTKVTCYIPTGATAVTTPYLYFRKTDATARVFYVDTLSMTLAAPSTPNVQVGSGTNGGPTTLFTLDRGASAPIAGDNESLLGSMYYDTTLGKLQCYEADGWGACGSSPDNIITISPEYTNAVMHGTGVGTMISDLCSDFLNINDGSSGQSTICGANETYNFYNWTSPQASSQTYSIYVTYQLPSTFKSFSSGSTSLQGRVSSTSNASINYSIYKSTGSSMVQCGSSVSVASGAANTWETKVASGAADPSACGFSAGNSIVFKISMSANSNANAYIGNIGFTFSNN